MSSATVVAARAPARIWLCDLTYTQQTISSDVMPAAVGCIATYAKRMLGERVDVRVFKFPEKLAAALERSPPPDVVGFSNYIWNCNLSSAFARVVKAKFPHVVTVMGGPNYPTEPAEQEAFLRKRSMFDFYIVKEGEAAFARLTEALMAARFDVAAVDADLPSVHRILPDGTFRAAKTVDRITDLAEIPSPYLEGLLDEYFDGTMLPIIQTNRGCPFRCTFCVEGESYYSRVSKTRSKKIDEEIVYISKRMAALRDAGRARSDLHIADSNFGMYKEDLDTCRTIAEMQKDFGYPTYISVATGKNHKERVLEAAKLINGALRLSGSVQSLDAQVLRNIDRGNIDEKKILDLALAASEVGANSYSEIILALPGDTLAAHLRTIEAIVEADFNTVALYQLMLLPGTELASRESIKKWQMQTKYRVLPRCFGYFDVLGEKIEVAEIEEICVANSSLTFDDYLACRRMHLVINLFLNDGVFKEVLRLINALGLSKYQWLRRIWAYDADDAFSGFVRAFLDETVAELWDEPGALATFVQNRKVLKRYIDGGLGANLIFKYKTLGYIENVGTLARVASATLQAYLEESGCDPRAVEFGGELIEFARMRMSNIFVDQDAEPQGRFAYDVVRFAADTVPRDVASYTLVAPTSLAFTLTRDQRKILEEFAAIYGTSVMGLSRTLSKVYVRRLFRNPTTLAVAGVELLGRQEALVGQAGLTGLNEFS